MQGLPFSGHSYCFETEFRALYPDLTRADWNAVLHWVLSLPESEECAATDWELHHTFLVQEKKAIFDRLMLLFSQTAEPFARLLIDESFLPLSRRCVVPDPSFGGVAGGEKFRVHPQATQLFKFALDRCVGGKWIYGGGAQNDMLAMKSAGHELKGAQALLDAGVAELFCPLMAVFTYRGKRVLCSSLLPINAQTVVHPPSPGQNAQVEVQDIMCVLADRLWIESNPNGTFGPFDLEIHRGHDGKFYVVDAARLMPPQYVEDVDPEQSWMYRLLRPELVRKAKIKLRADAFSLRHGTAEARLKIREATEALFMEMAGLAVALGDGTIALHASAVKDVFHAHGINLRFIPNVAALLDAHSEWKTRLEQTLEERRQLRQNTERCYSKALRPPLRYNEKDVLHMLEAHEWSLRRGASRMLLVPTLLQLGSLVRPTNAGQEEALAIFQRTKYDVHRVPTRFLNRYQPMGRHPYVQAWKICEAEDPLLRVDKSSLSIVGCSPLTVLVIFKLTALLARHFAHFDITYPTLSDSLVNTLPTRSYIRVRLDLPHQSELESMLARVVQEGLVYLFKMVTHTLSCARLATAVAVASGHAELVGWCMQQGVVVLVDEHLMSLAGESGSVPILMVVLAKVTASIDAALGGACKKGHVGAVQYLLGIAVERKMHVDLDKALKWACVGGSREVVEIVVAFGKAHGVTKWAVDSLVGAVGFGHVHLVEGLLALGMSINTFCPGTAFPLSFVALAEGRDCVMLERLFSHGFNPALGGSTLVLASQRGFIDAVKLLVEKGVDPNYALNTGVTSAFKACQEGHLEILQYLLSSKARVDALKLNGASLLSVAAEQGQLHVVRYLCEQYPGGVTIDSVKDDGSTPFFLACQYGHVETLKYLWARGANLMHKNKQNLCATPFWRAAAFSQLDVMRFFLDLADPALYADEKEKNGPYALQRACGSGRVDVARLLIAELGVNPNTPASCSDWGTTSDGGTAKFDLPLIAAALEGHLEVVEFLVTECGADVNGKRYTGATALHVAFRDRRILRWLCEHGADVTLRDGNGDTALHRAVHEAEEDIVAFLLARGATSSIIDDSLLSAAAEISDQMHAMLVAFRDRSSVSVPPSHSAVAAELSSTTNDAFPYFIAATGDECIKACKQGDLITVCSLVSDANIVDSDGMPALHAACLHSHVVSFLLEKGAVVDRRFRGWTALHLASVHGVEATVRILVEQKANVDAHTGDEAGVTSLYLASQEGHGAVVALLLALSPALANVRKPDDGCTPLFPASQNGHLGVVRLLLKHRADADLVSHARMSPLCLAVKEQHRTIVQCLIQEGFTLLHHHHWRALCFACRRGLTEIVELLVCGMRIDVNDCQLWYGGLPLADACECGHLDLVQYLVEKAQANMDLVCSRRRMTSLAIAVVCSNLSLVEYLTSHGATVHREDVLLACQVSSSDVVRLLLRFMMGPVKIIGDDARSLCWTVCWRGDDESLCCELLSDPSEMHEGASLTLLAAANGWLMLMGLIRKSCNIAAPCDESGLTALHVACWMEQNEMADFLKASGCLAETSIPHPAWKNFKAGKCSGSTALYQFAQHCLTCWPERHDVGVCAVCVQLHHVGHELGKRRFRFSHCSLGLL